MTDAAPTLHDFETHAQQAIQDFDAADGFQLRAQAHEGGAGYLELVGQSADGGQAFAYRASRRDLEAHGDSWFLRRAMRSLNDLFVAGRLPQAGGEAGHQVLRPPSEYRLPDADPEVNDQPDADL